MEKSRFICFIYLERIYFFFIKGYMNNGKVEHSLPLLLVFLLSGSASCFVLSCSLASAMTRWLSFSRLVREPNKSFWQTHWVEVVRCLFFGITFEFYCLYHVYILFGPTKAMSALNKVFLSPWYLLIYLPSFSPHSKCLSCQFVADEQWVSEASAMTNGTRAFLCKTKFCSLCKSVIS